jgi:molybdate transport system regulatory protein
LVDNLNRCFRVPVVASQTGGQHGGGASLTEFGHAVIRHYRELESAAELAGAAHIRALAEALAERVEPAGEAAAKRTRRLPQNLG